MGVTATTRPRKGSPRARDTAPSATSEGAGRAVSEVLLGEAAASGRVAMVLSDDDLNYIAANDTACTLLRYDRADLLARRVSDVVPKPPARLTEVSRRITSGKTEQGRTEVRRGDGTTLEIEYMSFASTVAGLPYVLSLFWPAS